MTPKKLLIAQRLAEQELELQAIATMADEYRHQPRWQERIAELRRTAELARFWATEIRSEP
jgi:hypothetical protein